MEKHNSCSRREGFDDDGGTFFIFYFLLNCQSQGCIDSLILCTWFSWDLLLNRMKMVAFFFFSLFGCWGKCGLLDVVACDGLRCTSGSLGWSWYSLTRWFGDLIDTRIGLFGKSIFIRTGVMEFRHDLRLPNCSHWASWSLRVLFFLFKKSKLQLSTAEEKLKIWHGYCN